MATLRQSPPPIDPELTDARGVVRDGLGAMSNLWGLLRSVRIGPKAITDVLPDVQASCGPLYLAFERLLNDTPALDQGCREQLRALALPRVRQIESTLKTSRRGALRASRRLELERNVQLALTDLGVARTLLDLAHDCSSGRHVPCEAAELARETVLLLDASAPGTQRLSIALSPPKAPVMIFVNPRAAMGLLALSAALAAGVPAKGTVTLEIEPSSAKECGFRFAPATGEGDLTFIVPVALPVVQTSAKLLASTLGAPFSRTDGGVTFAFPIAGSA